MKYSELNHSGYLLIAGKHTAYDLKDGYFTIHVFDKISEFEPDSFFLTSGFDGKQYLLHTPIPVDLSGVGFFPRNVKQEVDFVVKDFEIGAQYSEARFTFAELQYFCPSTNVVKLLENDDVLFQGKSEAIRHFDVEIDGKKCEISFVVSGKGEYALANSNMRAESTILVKFEKTDDFDFLEKIYLLVDSVFAFICNRRNTTCTSMELVGSFLARRPVNGKIVEEPRRLKSEMYFIDKFRDEPESKDIAGKAIKAIPLFYHIGGLFVLMADDLSRSDADDPANISITSIPPSVERRRLIDLQQSLHITAAFEFYVRRYMPDMVKEEPHHSVLRNYLQEFIDNHTGKEKKLAKNLQKHVVDEPALADKILKAYEGYKDWLPLRECLPEERFSSDNIPDLASEANSWRNELAHEKRSYEPNLNTVRAIRLLEHFNYAIVLRQIGCSDSEIKDLLENILAV